MFELELKIGKLKLARESIKSTIFSSNETLSDTQIRPLQKDSGQTENNNQNIKDKEESKFNHINSKNKIESKLLKDLRSQIHNEKFKMITNLKYEAKSISKPNTDQNEFEINQKINKQRASSLKTEKMRENSNSTFTFYARLLLSLKLNEKQILSDSYKKKESYK